MAFGITFTFKFWLSVIILFHQNSQSLPGLSANEFLKIHIEFILHSVHFRNSQSSQFTKWQNIKIFFICTELNNKISMNLMKMCIRTLLKSYSNFIVWKFSSVKTAKNNNINFRLIPFQIFLKWKKFSASCKISNEFELFYASDVTYLSRFLILIGL